MASQPKFFTPAAATALSLGQYQPLDKLQASLRTGLILTGVLVFGFGGLASLLPMAGAVIAGGEVTVANAVKQIAHPHGGVVKDILVRDGMFVKQGQPLIMLDDTVSSANSQFTGETVDQLLARAGRLAAERDGLRNIRFPDELVRRASNPDVAALMREERSTFRLRRITRAGLVAQLNQRIAQAQVEMRGSMSQAGGYMRQSALIEDELKVTRELYEKRYATLDRLNVLERAAVGLGSNADSARTSASATQARIAELRVQAAVVEQEARSQAAADLMEVQGQIAEQRRQKVSADDSFDRSIIRAPQSGVIDKLAFKTIGGVIPPGERVMEIVPDKDELVVNVRVPISDIDQVSEGQSAALRFSAFSLRTTPEIEGTVTHVSADRTVDEATGIAFYKATVALSAAEIAKLGKVRLKPGMPVETFIQTGDRTMLSYILKPLGDQWARAFRQNY